MLAEWMPVLGCVLIYDIFYLYYKPNFRKRCMNNVFAIDKYCLNN